MALRNALLWLALICALSLGAAAEDLALPALTGRVIDRAEILSSGAEAALSAKIEAHEKATTDQIVIVTLPDLMGRPIEDWGLMLGRSWGIGQKGKDNGIVFLIAPNDRELRIEVGYGLEGSLPDATANEIIQSEVIPQFKRGNMEAGVTAGLNGILAALGGTYHPTPLALSNGPEHYAPIFDTLVPIFFFTAFVGIGIVMSLRRRWDKKKNRYVWYIARSTGSSSSSGSFSSSSGGFSSSRGSFGGSRSGFSGGGGSFGGGGASGKW